MRSYPQIQDIQGLLYHDFRGAIEGPELDQVGRYAMMVECDGPSIWDLCRSRAVGLRLWVFSICVVSSCEEELTGPKAVSLL